MDFDLIAPFQFECVDYRGGKADRQTVAPFRDPQGFLHGYMIYTMYIKVGGESRERPAVPAQPWRHPEAGSSAGHLVLRPVNMVMAIASIGRHRELGWLCARRILACAAAGVTPAPKMPAPAIAESSRSPSFP